MPKITPSNIPLMTTFIAATQFDRPALAKQYDIYIISYQHVADKQERAEVKKTIPGQLYKTGCILSLVDDFSKHYYVLLPQQHNFRFDDPRVAVKRANFDYTPPYVLDKLLLRALARNLTQANGAVSRFEQNGLYYLVDFKKTRKAKTINNKLVAVEIDIDTDWSGNNGTSEVPRALIAKVVTFTPVEELQDASGKLYPEYARGQRYALDLTSALVSKSVKGDYIKAAASKFKNRVAAIDLKDLDLELFERTKTGVINQCLEDIKTVYGDMFTVTLASFSSHLELLPKGNEIQKHYAAIHQQLLQHAMVLVNTTKDKQAEQKLLLKLAADGYQAMCAEAPEQGSLNLLITYNKDTYPKGQDPYQLVKQANLDVIIQNCTIENLFDANGQLSSHVYEVLLKELFVKLELSTKQILLDNMPDTLGATYILAEHISNDAEIRYHSLKIDNAKIQFGLLSQADIAILKQLISPQHSKMLTGSKWQVKPLMYWPEQQEYVFITDTPAVPLADLSGIMPILLSIEHSRGKVIPKALIEQFCQQYPGNSAAMLLQQHLAKDNATNDMKVSDAKAILKDKSLLRSRAKEQLNQWLQNYGITLWQSVKKRQDGFLQAHWGLRVFAEHHLYFSANVQAVKASYGNFSRMYRLCGNRPDIPINFYDLLTPSHIRHKQYSVMPFPFKYLREEEERLRTLSTYPTQTPKASTD
ncbi:hypothetical protein LMJ53_14245 [Rheinheimera sp. UJ51]|uniref:hypothetical protein n=1 Tax=Rheinheimera sp. UJ51 TaxID=2892446 RepID=UPI001E2FB5F2|nr:hypothetical protein [Rheinheimera sp. UJ51]MCC5452884.1 hypothetical protein [Rheinheimera sp. UJ51]